VLDGSLRPGRTPLPDLAAEPLNMTPGFHWYRLALEAVILNMVPLPLIGESPLSDNTLSADDISSRFNLSGLGFLLLLSVMIPHFRGTAAVGAKLESCDPGKFPQLDHSHLVFRMISFSPNDEPPGLGQSPLRIRSCSLPERRVQRVINGNEEISLPADGCFCGKPEQCPAGACAGS